MVGVVEGVVGVDWLKGFWRSAVVGRRGWFGWNVGNRSISSSHLNGRGNRAPYDK